MVFVSYTPPSILEFHFDTLIMGGVFKGFFIQWFLFLIPLGRKRRREEEEDSKEGTLSPKDPKPSLKGSTPESLLLPLNPKPSLKAQGLSRTFELGITQEAIFEGSTLGLHL